MYSQYILGEATYVLTKVRSSKVRKYNTDVVYRGYYQPTVLYALCSMVIVYGYIRPEVTYLMSIHMEVVGNTNRLVPCMWWC